ncbi:hypothetical protein [Chitinimonas naiadis]
MFNIFKKKPVLNPGYPVVEGRDEMTTEWSIAPSVPFNRRFENSSLVFWRPGITAWILIWDNPKGESVDTRLSALRARRSSEAFDEKESRSQSTSHYSYRLNEEADDKRVAALYAFAFSDVGHVQVSVYFDKEADLSIAEALCMSIEAVPAQP